MWKLVIEDDEGKRTVVPLSRDDYTIGRQEGNTIRLTERNVSRTHGCVRRSREADGDAGFVIEDLRSYNGVFVNGLRVAHTQDLQHGDLIQIGDYRIVLQDDSVSAIEAVTMPVATDAKATIPIASAYRGQTLTERPNRLVMLVGPTPGVEYPLDRERMTVGRAEDATVSVNHNSVSRLHCEIHALGGGRFEIVDKASSNGVRVNGVDLKRSIIEAGDVIELGDVRFKFVAAGQVFVPGPNESQQLTAITDREAELATSSRKGLGGYALPILGAGVVGAAIILALVYFVRQRAMADPREAITSVPETEQTVLAEAKAHCSVDDCEQSHVSISTFPETSPWREHADYRFIVSTWAESLLEKARSEPDPISQRATLERILADPAVDPAQKTQASELLASVEPPPTPTPTDLPTVATKEAGTAAPPPTSRPTRPPGAHTTATTVTSATAPAPVSPKPSTSAPVSSPKPSTSALERARAAALREDPKAVRDILEDRVRHGQASTEEANLVRAACKAMRDKACVDDVKQRYPQL